MGAAAEMKMEVAEKVPIVQSPFLDKKKITHSPQKIAGIDVYFPYE